jgi:hypothetical protein
MLSSVFCALMLWRCSEMRRQLLRKGLWGLLQLVLVPWLAVVGHQLWRQRLVASGAVPKFRTSDNEFAVRPAGILYACGGHRRPKRI